jgi:hypothetical protein
VSKMASNHQKLGEKQRTDSLSQPSEEIRQYLGLRFPASGITDQ